jgi:glucose-1-phosphate adenylyltransferase
MREAPQVLGIVLAGGEGKRLYPLTADRAKPAVPFGGAYRLIDFVLSNLVNARYLRICVLTQYKSHSLDRHISQNWRLSGLAGEYITPVPAQQRLGPRWYTGSADAIYQSLNLIYDADPDYIVVFGADHVYRMDPEQMVQFHVDSGAGATVAGIRVPRAEASAFGCIAADESGRIRGFIEKPLDPPGTPDDPDSTFVSMGNYIFTTKVLIDAIRADADDDNSDHDMGADIIPRLVSDAMAAVYDFSDNEVPGANVVIDDGAIVEGSVIMPGVRVGRGAVVRHAILDKNVVVGPGEMVGVDLERDRERFAISAGGVVAVGKGVWI